METSCAIDPQASADHSDSAAATLAVMLDRKLVFVSGKGGVGKSAVTASLALLASRRGLRVLAVGMVEGLGLAGHFGVDRLGYSPSQVRSGTEALTVYRDEALDEYLRLQLHVPRATPTKILTRALDVLAETAPGIREIVTIGKPVYELWQSRYDLVLVDAPPLGQLFSYLRAPNTIADLVPAGPIQRQANHMRESLADSELTSLVLVTTPEELPVLETRATLDRIAVEPVITLDAVVVNRLLNALPIDAEILGDLPEGPHRAAAEHHLTTYRQQQRWLQAVESELHLPYLFGLHTAGEVAEQMADVWDELI
jgi:anion-transporting  ArsA/GET3 family ATPase